uniref:ribosomal protein L19 n=1 Tax=Chroodactylon ornatum TaxID=139907 RepID=UPI001FCD4928|nr:ribosomal protein L19 [Chroodactylon ornatum]UNJ14619.1 ribosomal protein L19 [Chroodactylon ornatum]
MNFPSIVDHKAITLLESNYMKSSIPELEIGDYVKIGILIQEGNKERTQYCRGVIICKKNHGINLSIIVRYSLQGVGVERTFLIHSPRITNIEVTRKSKVRRAKLYYLRSRFGKSTRLKTRFT